MGKEHKHSKKDKQDKKDKKHNKKSKTDDKESEDEAPLEQKRNPRNYDDPENKIKVSEFHKPIHKKTPK